MGGEGKWCIIAF
jgi:hypothetical protein